ncbi:E3 ubiquitin-protein ligase DTX3L [Esox lucius]|uniref:E3 ubiquitin-protein ligase DTX3L n=1 Tax=Esox lucius TaxID=8010 RepID=UPI000576E3FD|nr:E3 ubiquitin-protein ligase DTX3L [Esox lucius]
MGAQQEKMHCNRYLDGHGPRTLMDQAKEEVKGSYAVVSEGDQPEGQMTWVMLHRDLPGYPEDKTLQICYVFADGKQTERHPHPGQSYLGMRTLAYLPDNRDGRRILMLLEKAFKQKLIFTVATNEHGMDMVTWADIPHKTSPDAGRDSDHYPDPDYLKTVRKILKDKGME